MQIKIIISRFVAGAVILIVLAQPAFSQTAAETASKDSTKRDDVSLLKQQIAEQQNQIAPYGFGSMSTRTCLITDRQSRGAPGWSLFT